MTTPTESTTVNSSPDVQKRISSYAHRIHHLMVEQEQVKERELKPLQEDIKEVVAEAKGNGFDPKMIRRTAKELHRILADRAAYDEDEAMFKLYMGSVLADLGVGPKDEDGANVEA